MPGLLTGGRQLKRHPCSSVRELRQRQQRTGRRIPHATRSRRIVGQPLANDLQRREHDLLDRSEIPIPQHLRLLAQRQNPIRANGAHRFGHLQQQPLIGPDRRLRPVDFRLKRQHPSVRQQHRNAAGLQRLQEPERAETATARHQTERGVQQQRFVVVAVVLAVVVVAARILQLAPALAVAAGRHQDEVARVVQVEEGVARLRADAVHVPVYMDNGYGEQSTSDTIVAMNYVGSW